MKKIFILSFILTTGIVSNAFSATSGTCGEKCTWEIKDGVLEISGEGDMDNYSNSSKQPWHSQRKNITSIKVNEGIKSIGDRVFTGFSNATTVSLPNTLEKIGAASFADTGIKNLVIPDSVRSLGSFMISGPVETVTIGKGVTKISDAFRCNDQKSDKLIKVYYSNENQIGIIENAIRASQLSLANVKLMDVKYKVLENPVTSYTVETATVRADDIGCEEINCSLKMWFK